MPFLFSNILLTQSNSIIFCRSFSGKRHLQDDGGLSVVTFVKRLVGLTSRFPSFRIDVLELVNLLQGLTIKQDGLALLTSDGCSHHLGHRGVNAHPLLDKTRLRTATLCRKISHL